MRNISHKLFYLNSYGSQLMVFRVDMEFIDQGAMLGKVSHWEMLALGICNLGLLPIITPFDSQV